MKLKLLAPAVLPGLPATAAVAMAAVITGTPDDERETTTSLAAGERTASTEGSATTSSTLSPQTVMWIS
jgi:hypothetical protein